ncbi:MAG: hypothetical protein BAJALOKI2v1_880001 [Promethearchaeota archaeon]|nr:MAG: hypothetical protein BAJALOKI2v1_880001 [Candidatus Lokiarchaeota archaeon]
MAKDELFIKRVFEIINELKIPLIDERVYDDVKISAKRGIIHVIFKFLEDESVIRGFLGLAEYFHSIIIKQEDQFFIPHNNMLFVLESE